MRTIAQQLAFGAAKSCDENRKDRCGQLRSNWLLAQPKVVTKTAKKDISEKSAQMYNYANFSQMSNGAAAIEILTANPIFTHFLINKVVLVVHILAYHKHNLEYNCIIKVSKVETRHLLELVKSVNKRISMDIQLT